MKFIALVMLLYHVFALPFRCANYTDLTHIAVHSLGALAWFGAIALLDRNRA